jgi:hypothetical protein
MTLKKTILLLAIGLSSPVSAQQVDIERFKTEELKLSEATRNIIARVDLNQPKSTSKKKDVATTVSQDDAPIETSDERFSRSLLKAARQMVRDGKMTRRDQLKLRVAMLSPAFRKHAEELAALQIYYSGQTSPDAPLNDDGRIELGSINWEGIASFLERLMPLILKLIDVFGSI